MKFSRLTKPEIEGILTNANLTDDEELDKIELEELQRISYNPYYLKFNENTKFFNAGFMMYSPNVISICVDSELMKILEKKTELKVYK